MPDRPRGGGGVGIRVPSAFEREPVQRNGRGDSSSGIGPPVECDLIQSFGFGWSTRVNEKNGNLT